MNKSIRCPDYVMQRDDITQRQWRQRKRKEVEDVRRAVRILLYGSAFTPHVEGFEPISLLHKIKEVKKAWSQKQWGR